MHSRMLSWIDWNYDLKVELQSCFLSIYRSIYICALMHLLNLQTPFEFASKQFSFAWIIFSISPVCGELTYWSVSYSSCLSCRNVVLKLLQFEASTNVADSKGCFPLHLAAWRGDVDIVRILIHHGPSHCRVNQQVRDTKNIYPELDPAYPLSLWDVLEGGKKERNVLFPPKKHTLHFYFSVC